MVIRLAATVSIYVLAAASALAQTAPPVPATVAAPQTAAGAIGGTVATGPMILRQGTAISFRTDKELSSKTSGVGERFELRVSEDVKLGSVTVIPAGARGVGEVTRVERKGSFGKSGKIDTRVLYVVAGDHRIPLTGNTNQAGDGGTAATVAVAVVAGVFSAFVTGKSAVLPAGTIMTGYLENDVPIAPGPAPAPMAISLPATPAPAPAVAGSAPADAAQPQRP